MSWAGAWEGQGFGKGAGRGGEVCLGTGSGGRAGIHACDGPMV